MIIMLIIGYIYYQSCIVLHACMRRLVNNKTFRGVAKEKEAAAVEFQDRQEAGQNVGLVESRYV